MGDVALPAGYQVATIRLGEREADLVLHGSAGEVFLGSERAAIGAAARPGCESRVVLLASVGRSPSEDRYIIRTVREFVPAVANSVELDLDAAGLDVQLADASPEVVAIVGETTYLPAVTGRIGASTPIGDDDGGEAELFGVPTGPGLVRA